MAGTSLNMDLSEFAAWARAAGRDLADLDYTKALKSCRVAIVASVKENFAGGHGPDGQAWAPLKHSRPGSRGSDKPLRDKGLLMASITSAAGNGHVETMTPTSLVFGTNLEYAATHQYGATITPKSAGALTIPLTREAVRAGGGSQFPQPLFILEAASGKAFLAEARQKGKGKRQHTELTFHYVLADRVIIPARPFLGISEKLADTVAEIFRAFLAKKLGGGKGGVAAPPQQQQQEAA